MWAGTAARLIPPQLKLRSPGSGGSPPAPPASPAPQPGSTGLALPARLPQRAEVGAPHLRGPSPPTPWQVPPAVRPVPPPLGARPPRPARTGHAQSRVTRRAPEARAHSARGRPDPAARRAAMERIEGAAVGRCAASPYLRPLTLHYRQPPRSTLHLLTGYVSLQLLENGTQKSWDFMKTHDRAWCW
ncbi:uridine diphosphate glucose pyrophosphatase NUDT14 isoform X4 [Neofelis nebulosa]|uniref:uridine diphosphate glucose pyrophosphatase NUDT14 isoform X4 n=1 Tax=Neofelis nebulosa TaxID=61452 RepID=UPI00272BEBCD|nr:uridine diphosphate glucose pyrophosphatase NUDT14 isoform X4 [Neofelis nebulosa]XP_058596479.1 uridine diphosphate glucose pyrophosphatase NUDT14 isoform X4 [Neofelis nebulosa]